MKKEICKELAASAFRGTSFSSDQRGAQAIKDFNVMMENDRLKIMGFFTDSNLGYETVLDHYNFCIGKYIAWLNARGKCMSSMITGPSNFPVRRAEKANKSSDNLMQAFYTGRDKSLKRARKIAFPLGDGPIILARDPEILEKLKVKLNNLLIERKNLKKLKVFLNSPDRYKQEILQMGIEKELLIRLISNGTSSINLANVNQKIKYYKTRLADVESQKRLSLQEYTFQNGVVVVNPEIMRVQVFYKEKPSNEIRENLKSKGFKYSKAYNSWQRILSNSAINVCEMVFSISMKESYIN
jgi:hypothetical protein